MDYQEAKRKAKYGHRDWVSYKDREGKAVYAPANAATVKAAMLATGTQKKWVLIGRDDGIGMLMSWRFGINVYRQFVKGWR